MRDEEAEDSRQEAVSSQDTSISSSADHASSSLISHPSSIALRLDLGIALALLLLAFCAPLTIAGTQGAWVLALLLWVVRLWLKPRPRLRRTPLDYALLGFVVLTVVSSFFSYDPEVSIAKLRAVSLFTIVYVVAENVATERILRVLTLTLVASCAVSTVYAFAEYAVGRGVKFVALAPESPLRAGGVGEGDTVVEVDAHAVANAEELERRIRAGGEQRTGVLRWPDGSEACAWDEESACLDARRGEQLAAYKVARSEMLAGETAEARLGIMRWARGRDERASGLYGHYTTYAEVLQLIASLALGLLIALQRKASLRGALFVLAFALMVAALVLTVTRASWLGLLLSAFTIALAGASRRTLLLTAAVALPLIVAGLFVLQQKRRVGFIDPKEGSTAWRLVVWREGVDILTDNPRHMLVGTGMDSLKRHWREWNMFDGGRLPVGHLHSTPLQIAFERGLPALLLWLALIGIYARMLWRLARRRPREDETGRGLALGALGGTVGFFASGLVHYNLGDSEVVMVFYLLMGLTLALERMERRGEASQVA